MSTKTIERKLNNLSQEMTRLRSLIISVVSRDSEGEYKPEFVEEILKLTQERQPSIRFTTPADFLKRVRKA